MEKRKKIIKYIGILALLCCTAIGCYGIISAPASDQSELEEELMRNEQLLEQSDSLSETETASEAETSSETQPPATGAAVEEKTPERTITVIGDSVFLGAAPAFKKLEKNAVIDAKISRQVYHGIDVARKLNKKHKLGDTVIISLGTNSNFNPATGQELLDYLGAERTIYWINVYGKNLDIQQQVNATIQKLAKKNDNVHVISWADEGKKHPDWFYQDGVHLNTRGQPGFAEFIEENIN
ncbi:MAG: hypothetical protein J1F02_04200 [Lachnospiraceae bacterium]|nr:hypothetical protein [Lachnospiraceae bacterium]